MGAFNNSNEISTDFSEKKQYDNSRSVGVLAFAKKAGFITLNEGVNKDDLQGCPFMFKPILSKDGAMKTNAKGSVMLAFYVKLAGDSDFTNIGLYNLMAGIKLPELKAAKEASQLELSFHATSTMSEADLLDSGAF